MATTPDNDTTTAAFGPREILAQTPDTPYWNAMLRGSVLSAALAKNNAYIVVADLRARGMVLINSFVIPLAITGAELSATLLPAMCAIIGCALSIIAAMISLYP